MGTGCILADRAMIAGNNSKAAAFVLCGMKILFVYDNVGWCGIGFIVFDIFFFFFLGRWGMSGGNGGGPVTWGKRGLLSKVYIRRLGGW